MCTQHFVNTTGILACSPTEPAIFLSCSGRSLPSVMFHANSMNTNIINTYTHAHSPLTVLPSLNDAFIATAIQTEYQRSFNTQTLNYSHVTQTRRHISDTSCTKFQPSCVAIGRRLHWQFTKQLIHKQCKIRLLSETQTMDKKSGTPLAYKPMKALRTTQISVFT